MQILRAFNNLPNQSVFLLILAVFALSVVGAGVMPNWLIRVPDNWIVPVIDWINVVLRFVLDDFWIVTIIEDDYEEEYTMAVYSTRLFSSFIQWWIDIFRNLLIGGDKGFGLPALPWTSVAAIAFVVGYALKGWKLSLFAGTSVIFLAVFGQWTEAMQTLSLVFVAAPLSLAIGLLIGVLCYRHRKFELFFAPLLSVTQTLPYFSYLVPVAVFFGIGDHAGAIATIVFATPPMIQMTLLGLKRIPPEFLEAGKMSGCSSNQLLFKVQLPSARQDLMLGVNQVIMQCLAMVVIASFIGASGLGYKLLVSLNSLRIGQALEFGISIVLIAVVLDRLSRVWANKQPDYRLGLPFYTRYKFPLLTLGLVLITILFSQVFEFLYRIPDESVITSAWIWDWLVDWIVINWYDGLQGFRNFLLLHVLIPMRDAYLYLPTISVFILLAGISYMLGRIKSVLLVCSFFAFIAFTGWWDRAMITAYMVSFSVLISVLIGLTVGILCSRKKFTARGMIAICDTFQTFPSFVYLIPVIMLFQVNDVSVIFAIIIYSTIPATRYTIEGLRNVPESMQDAATMSGVNAIQRLFKIELPLAFPHIMVGINQTVIFALFMVIIGAFIGTQDIGQEIMLSLSESNMGKGLVLGLCVAFMGLSVDHLINKWALRRKQELGLS